jgi:hypothetical protein
MYQVMIHRNGQPDLHSTHKRSKDAIDQADMICGYVAEYPFRSYVYGVHYGHHKTKQAAINKVKRVHSEIRHQCGGVFPESGVFDQNENTTHPFN